MKILEQIGGVLSLESTPTRGNPKDSPKGYRTQFHFSNGMPPGGLQAQLRFAFLRSSKVNMADTKGGRKIPAGCCLEAATCNQPASGESMWKKCKHVEKGMCQYRGTPKNVVFFLASLHIKVKRVPFTRQTFQDVVVETVAESIALWPAPSRMSTSEDPSPESVWHPSWVSLPFCRLGKRRQGAPLDLAH